MDHISFVGLMLYLLLPMISAVVGYFVRSIHNRLDKLEHELHDTVSEEQVRVIIEDKVNPIRDDIRDVNHKLDSWFEGVVANLGIPRRKHEEQDDS